MLDQLSVTTSRITIACQVCKAQERAKLYAGGWSKWIQLPAGWIYLTECLQVVVRCPKCVPK